MVTGILAVAILLVTLAVFVSFILAGSYAVAAHLPGVEGLPYRFIVPARKVVFFTVLLLAGGGELWAVTHAWQDRCAHEQRALQQQQHRPTSTVQEI